MSISVVGDGLLLSQKGDLVVGDGTAEGRLAAGTDGQILSVSSTDSLGVKWINQPLTTQKWEVIGYSSLTANGTTISFSSIPQTYSDLKLISYVSHTSSVSYQFDMQIRVNDLTTGIYYYTTSGSIGVSTGTALAQFTLPDAMTGAGYFGTCVFDFPDYTSTTSAKQMSAYIGRMYEANNAGSVYLYNGAVNTTEAITKISLAGVSFAAPVLRSTSTLALIGVKR